MNDLLRSAVTGGLVVGLTGTLAPVVSLLSVRDEELPDPLIRFWAKSILRSAGVRGVARGLERLPRGNFVLALNHQSHFDVLMVLANVPRHLRFVAKAELFRIPVFGPALKAIGNIPVARKGGGSDRESMREAAEAARERVNIVFFAEGSRSDDGRLRPFKKGAAVLAIQAGVPLVPAAVAGTGRILPKKSLRVHGGHTAALVIGEPLSTEGLTAEDRDALTERAHGAVSALLEEANALVG